MADASVISSIIGGLAGLGGTIAGVGILGEPEVQQSIANRTAMAEAGKPVPAPSPREAVGRGLAQYSMPAAQTLSGVATGIAEMVESPKRAREEMRARRREEIAMRRMAGGRGGSGGGGGISGAFG